jgi:hypothetical protein
LGCDSSSDDNPLQLFLDLLAGGFQFRILAVGIVDKSAFVGIQRLGLDRPPVLADGVGEVTDALEEGILAHGSVELDVDDYPWGLLLAGEEQAVHEELEALEGFPPRTDKRTRVAGADLQDDAAVTHALLDLREKTKVA